MKMVDVVQKEHVVGLDAMDYKARVSRDLIAERVKKEKRLNEWEWEWEWEECFYSYFILLYHIND